MGPQQGSSAAVKGQRGSPCSTYRAGSLPGHMECLCQLQAGGSAGVGGASSSLGYISDISSTGVGRWPYSASFIAACQPRLSSLGRGRGSGAQHLLGKKMVPGSIKKTGRWRKASPGAPADLDGLGPDSVGSGFVCPPTETAALTPRFFQKRGPGFQQQC